MGFGCRAVTQLLILNSLLHRKQGRGCCMSASLLGSRLHTSGCTDCMDSTVTKHH